MEKNQHNKLDFLWKVSYYSSIFTIQIRILGVSKSFQRLLQWITVKREALEPLITNHLLASVLNKGSTKVQYFISGQK